MPNYYTSRAAAAVNGSKKLGLCSVVPLMSFLGTFQIDIFDIGPDGFLATLPQYYMAQPISILIQVSLLNAIFLCK